MPDCCGSLDGRQAERRDVDRHPDGCGLLGKVGGRPVPVQPVPHLDRVAVQVRGCVAHVDGEGVVHRLVADAEPEDEPAAGVVGDQAGALRAGVGVAQVDAGDPGADLDVCRGAAHELRLDLGDLPGGSGEGFEGRVGLEVAGQELELVDDEPGLGLPGDVPDVAGPPPGAGDDRESQSLCAHTGPLSLCKG